MILIVFLRQIIEAASVFISVYTEIGMGRGGAMVGVGDVNIEDLL